MRLVFVCLSFLAIVSLSSETCRYEKNTPVQTLIEVWWTKGNEQSERYNSIITCNFVDADELQYVNYQQRNEECSGRYYYCNKPFNDYYALIVKRSNIKVLSQFVVKKLLPLKSIKISDSNMQIIENGTFEHFVNLLEVDLSKNNLTSLPSMLFASNAMLKIIDLSNNIISSVQNKTFLTQNLKCLNLRNNRIQKLDFKLPQSVINLDLSFNSITFILNDLFSNLTRLAELRLSHNHLHTLPTGLLTANTNLEVVDFSYNNISAVGNIVFFLHSIENLNLQNNNLEKIDFTLPFSLVVLDISFNKVHSIKHEIFVGLNVLITLKLNNNLLETIPWELFNPLNKLENVDLQNNRISVLPNKLFAFNNYLKIVNLAKNRISTVEQLSVFSDSIEYLNLTNNKLHYLNFTLPSSLLCLDLSSNLINSVYNLSFFNTTNIKEIHLNNNVLQSIPSDLFKQLNNINYINLQDNNIVVLPKRLFNFNISSNLTLNLSNNSITSLSEDTFPPHGITNLYMQHNKLKKINYKLPSSLLYLNLSSNLIQAIENHSLNKLTSLQSLWLSNNLLKELPPGYFKTLKSLQNLYLSNNRLTLVFGTFTGLNNLILLDLANNSITNLQEQMLFDLTNLVTLDISNNFLIKFNTVDIKKHMKNLRTIYMDGNKFQCPYIWDLIKYLKDNEINVPEGNDYDRSNVQGIYCSDIQENSDKSDNLALPEHINSGDKQEISHILKEILSDFISNNNLVKTATEEKLRLTLYNISSNFADINRLYNSSQERFQDTLKKISLNLNVTNKLLSTSEEHTKSILRELGTNFSSGNSISDAKIQHALEQIHADLVNFTTRRTSDNEFAKALRQSLEYRSSSFNATIHALNISYNNFGAEIKKFENMLLRLNGTLVSSAIANKEFLKMELMGSTPDATLAKDLNVSSSDKQIKSSNAYLLLQTVILFALLALTALMFYFLYVQISIIRKQRFSSGLTEMDNIVLE